ncbi:non-hydrolyzing UDP-N-acetylglucosamine 2-epimerase [Ruania halotolerans]|uniref:non-hydrolyzing UDP-N-acetylglucosamine 2-epimerase n=1 Tax=Ruania halotolerans TaxID=2897773 RepID=UPI001E46A28B|nr:UDP-N-acetylglucosamine 2-epimerase (non-hydrolyzing) [Ruania halotolerans]UFU07546.1 UDP-N-acetylglucosamine 2-epimerase (non-hydrolyzing) [Ruania halotolerans]
MRILSVVGARPQFVKLAPVAAACTAAGVDHVIVHTGQHYDELLSDVFFSTLHIPAPDVQLGIGSGSHAAQTGAMLTALEPVLLEHSPDWVLVYGDTNSTLAAALAGVKAHLPVAHLEAGLRSFNRRMPEEHNRVLTDHAADLLLAPTQVAAEHLAREGLAERTHVVGDVMTDVLHQVAASVAGSAPELLRRFDVRAGEFSVATIHRAENTDDRDRLDAILDGLGAVDHPVLLLAHPRLRATGADLARGAVRVLDPLGYPDLVTLISQARGVITDSGGLQKEAFELRVPCTTVRSETEWVETVELGWNQLAEPGQIAAAATRPRPGATSDTPYGDGHAAERTVRALASVS